MSLRAILRERHLGIQSAHNLTCHGPAPLLTKDEYKGLIEYVTYMSNLSYGYSRQGSLDLANAIIL